MNVLLSLGGFKFEIGKNAHKRLTQKSSFRWSEIKRLGGTSAMHFNGIDNDTITLAGTIYSEIGGGETYEKLYEEAGKGKPMVMVDAQGNNLGSWVITDISKDDEAINRYGVARKTDFNISLKGYE